MTRPSFLGLVIGLAASGLSIGTNLGSGDPHLVSLAPDLVTLMIIAALTSAGVRLAIRQQSRGAGREAGVHTAFLASVVCAVAMAVFTWWYLPTHSPLLAAFAGIGSFALVFIIGLATTFAGTQSHQRLHPTAGRRGQ